VLEGASIKAGYNRGWSSVEYGFGGNRAAVFPSSARCRHEQLFRGKRMKSIAISLSKLPLLTAAIVIFCFALIALQAPAEHKTDYRELKTAFDPAPQTPDALLSGPWLF
jgi:hypothetical protein